MHQINELNIVNLQKATTEDAIALVQIGVEKVSVAAKPVLTVKNALERPKPERIKGTSWKSKESISRKNFKVAFSTVLSARSKVIIFGFHLLIYLNVFCILNNNLVVDLLGCLWAHQQAKGSSSGH